MLYLIGGPPRCGKSKLAKILSVKTGLPFVSCDTLEAVGRSYVPKSEWPRLYPYSYLRRKRGERDNDMFYSIYSSRQIISALNKEAASSFRAIDAFVACSLADRDDYILEGCQLLPRFVVRLIKKYGRKNIRVVYLVKYDEQKFARDVKKSTTPNDWLLALTKRTETFLRVGQMVARYSEYFAREAGKYHLCVIAVDEDFKAGLKRAAEYLLK